MRIVDRGRKDYYDGVQGMGQDMSLTYVRTPKIERLDPEDGSKKGLRRWPFPQMYGHYCYYSRRTGYNIGIQDNVVGFCGKVYPALRLWNASKGGDCVWAHTLEAFDSAVRSLGFDDEEVEMYFESRWTNRARRSSVNYRGFPFRKDVEKHYFGEEGFEKHRDKHAKLFEENLTPVFLATYQGGWGSEGRLIQYNAILRPVEFMRVFDPYRAYQEISMYIGNMAFPNRPIPHVSDEDMAAAKGFDKFSFRKDPKLSKR